jgi:endo-1,4-beta-xylanase
MYDFKFSHLSLENRRQHQFTFKRLPLLAAALFAGVSLYAQSTPFPEIVSVNSGQCLDVPNGSAAEHVRIQQIICHGGPNQRWRLTGTGEIVNLSSGLCLDVPNGSTEDRVPIQQIVCHGGNNQRWRFTRTGEIISLNSRKCLDVPRASLAEHAQIEQFTCNGGNNQKWITRRL